jgi:chorismate dehydratase
VFDIFKKSMDYSMEHLDEIAQYAARWEPFSSSFLVDYFRTLRFDFDAEFQKGLLHFYKLAAEIGELEAAPELEFISLRSGAKK